MDLLRPSVLKELCARAGIRPDRKSGQNFLVNRGTLERIVEAVDPRPGDTILEVGAGFGVLTLALAERLAALTQQCSSAAVQQGRRIVAIERDRRITLILRELVMQYGNVEVVEGDILRMLRVAEQQGAVPSVRLSSIGVVGAARIGSVKWYRQTTTTPCDDTSSDTETVIRQPWKLAANLPYSITSDFLRLLFDAVGTGALPPPERAVLLLQREVVDRMCADPSRHSEHRNVGLLTILTQLHCSPRRIARVPAAHFWPAPKVESAVVVLEGWKKKEELVGLLGGPSRDNFLHIVRTAFGKRRGQLQRTLRSMTRDPEFILSASEGPLRMTRIDPTARPETLTLAQWIALARALHSAT